MADNLKNTGKGNLFVIFGEPDIDILPATGEDLETDGVGKDRGEGAQPLGGRGHEGVSDLLGYPQDAEANKQVNTERDDSSR